MTAKTRFQPGSPVTVPIGQQSVVPGVVIRTEGERVLVLVEHPFLSGETWCEGWEVRPRRESIHS